jgi:hypothetical protein
MQW